MTSSEIIVRQRFDYSLNHYKRQSSPSANYINRHVSGMFNYFINEKKRAVNMFDYFEGKINDHGGTVNLVLENGEYATEEEVEKRKKKYLKYYQNSNLWQQVISFNNDYIDENISLKDLEKVMSTKVLPKFFVKCGFKDINKMSYQIALHTNTDNYHFHISFIEKEPNYIDKKGNLTYRKVGMIKESDLNFLKKEIILNIEREKYFKPKLLSINKDIDELKKYFRPNEKNYILRNIDDLVLEENILRLGELVYEKRNSKQGKIKFNSIYNKEIKDLTMNIKKYLFKDKKSDLYGLDKEFKNDLNDLNEYLYDLNRRNNIKHHKGKNEIIDSKKEYLDNFVYNAIINHSSYLYGKLKEKKNYIKAEDLIQEAVLNTYKKNIKQNKFTVVKNYLSNLVPKTQFPNKHEIEQTLKKINNELEDAKTEFSKLFINNDYRNNQM